ncbi:MAG: MoaD/ThiS family protein [Candidatus Eisenbacteria bacterium]|uniref:Molybdopterin synthase sulfur carrier subunit n=1 Tax=Eiseniibacteriota bacterium TaxID=2212470 RepID=A0A956M3D1_UNCEI|nr:MoaD/ThiS family protein [Candidatus Eisenbacteria bacterium]
MLIQVRLFAQMRIEAEAERLELPVPEGSTVADALSVLRERHPRLTRHLDSCMFAVGLDYVKADRVLRSGDEISLIPPVQGG